MGQSALASSAFSSQPQRELPQELMIGPIAPTVPELGRIYPKRTIGELQTMEEIMSQNSSMFTQDREIVRNMRIEEFRNNTKNDWGDNSLQQKAPINALPPAKALSDMLYSEGAGGYGGGLISKMWSNN